LLSQQKNTDLVKSEASRLGFTSCGIAAAVQLDEDAGRLEQWLKKGYQGEMQYMERNFDLRIDPRKLVPGAKSVITLLLNYFPSQHQMPDAPKIAKYAFGTDYHFVIKEKLNELLHFIKENIGEVNGRGFVDSAPVLERSWAVRSGLITDLDLIADLPFKTGHCGTCTRCIDACPTQAIVSPTVIDAGKCISYLTIELKDALIPSEFHSKMEGWMFGCDTCQDVCPWNRFSKENTEPAFTPLPEVLNLSIQEWEDIGAETFNKVFKNSPLKRSKLKGVQRNIKAIRNNF
jgi:epoxyqueuosine reductase